MAFLHTWLKFLVTQKVGQGRREHVEVSEWRFTRVSGTLWIIFDSSLTIGIHVKISISTRSLAFHLCFVFAVRSHRLPMFPTLKCEVYTGLLSASHRYRTNASGLILDRGKSSSPESLENIPPDTRWERSRELDGKRDEEEKADELQLKQREDGCKRVGVMDWEGVQNDLYGIEKLRA